MKNTVQKSTNKSESSFLKQAGILAAAGLISRVLGLIYRVPITSIIGDEGNGYYGSAYEIYAVILLISSYSIPMAVSKIISEKLALKEYKNAHKIFRCSLIYVVVVGVVAAILTFIFAKGLVDVDGAVIPLRIMAPTIFFSGILSVYRGYFQAHSTMVPTSISQILEQLLNCGVSIAAAYWFVTLTTDDKLVPVYGASGSALGTGMGVLVALIFMLVMYSIRSKNIKTKLQSDTSTAEESYKEIFKIILTMVTPVILATFVYNISTSLDMKVYYGIMGLKGFSDTDMATYYGIFSGKYKVLQNVPIALATAISTAMVPGVSGSFATKDMDATRKKIDLALKGTMFITMPAAVGMGVLAKPIMLLLFPRTTSTAYYLLAAGAISIVFYAISTVSNGILQGVGKVKIPFNNAVISLIIHVIVLVPLLYFTKLNLYAILISTIVYALVMCILNQRAITKHLQYKVNVKKTYIYPLIAAVIMGAITYLIYTLIEYISASTNIGLLVAVPVAVIVYFVAIIMIGGITEHELLAMPKGKLIVRLLKKVKLLKNKTI